MPSETDIKAIIDRVLADGRLSQEETEIVKAAIYADKKVTPEEANLWRVLQDKIWNGEVAIDD